MLGAGECRQCPTKSECCSKAIGRAGGVCRRRSLRGRRAPQPQQGGGPGRWAAAKARRALKSSTAVRATGSTQVASKCADKKVAAGQGRGRVGRRRGGSAAASRAEQRGRCTDARPAHAARWRRCCRALTGDDGAAGRALRVLLHQRERRHIDRKRAQQLQVQAQLRRRAGAKGRGGGGGGVGQRAASCDRLAKPKAHNSAPRMSSSCAQPTPPAQAGAYPAQARLERQVGQAKGKKGGAGRGKGGA